MEQNRHIHTSSVEETQRFAFKLAKYLQAGDIITLSGDLGAGKTSFTQGLARGLGVKRHVNSPTFTIIKEYEGEKLPLFHMDTYRLDDEAEELGFDEYFNGDGVTVVEWPEKIAAQLPKQKLHVNILKVSDDERTIELLPDGKRYDALLKEVLA